MNQVLDEIGIEIKGKMDSAPSAGSSSLAGKILSPQLTTENRT